MDSQLFFLLNFVVAGIFLLWFFTGRKGDGRRPTQLDLTVGPEAKATMQKDIVRSESAIKPQAPPPPPPKSTNSSEDNNFRDVTHTASFAESAIKNKQKRVLFIYNGHDWDAYEVLGVGPSSTLPEITKKYQDMIRNADQGQIEFLEVAYKTLLKNF